MMSDFEFDLFVEPDVVSKFVLDDDGLGLAGSVRFSTDGLSAADLVVLNEALRDCVVVNKGETGDPVSARVRVRLLKGDA
jgi:hypothetical protein